MMIALALVALVAAWFALAFNRFVRQQHLMREAWSGIDVQLKRRHDLIPNLVEAVRGYRDYEKELFERIASLRAQCLGTDEPGARQGAENELTKELRKLFAVAEAYPDLKANEQFLDLQKTLASIEGDVQLARRYYNGTVRDWNIRVESFPSLLVARVFTFHVADYFELESATEREVPSVAL
jgi:LemA protein